MDDENEKTEVTLTPELKAQFDSVGEAVTALRAKVDEMEAAKAKPDGIDEDQLKRMNDTIDKAEDSIKLLEKAQKREIRGEVKPESADAQASDEYKQALDVYFRKGNAAPLQAIQAKAMSVNSDADGGYTVTPEMSATISKVIQEFSPIRPIASVETIGSDRMQLLVDKDEAGAGWVGETASRPATDTPQLGLLEFPVHEMYAEPNVTQKLLDDSNINIEDWVASKVADTFAEKEGLSFISGDGVNSPRGFLTYADGTDYGQIEQIANGHATVLSADSILNLVYGIKDSYARNGTFVMKRASIGQVRLLKESTTNAYIWQAGLQAGQPSTLAGAPVVEAQDMPVIGNGTLPIAFGDFRRGYQIVDRIGVRVIRDELTAKPFIKFYTTKRVGGGVKNFEAIKLLKMSA